MSPSARDERVGELLKLADEAENAGDLNKVANILKEASQLQPDNDQVQKRWLRVQRQDAGDGVLSLIRTYLTTGKEEDGQKALDVLTQTTRANTSIPAETIEIVDLLLQAGEGSGLLDELTSAFLSKHTEGRRHVATKLSTNATDAFEQLLARGERTFNFAGTVALEDLLWSNPEAQKTAQQDVFRLCIATLMDAGVDKPAMLVKTIARQLAVKPDAVAKLIDEDVVDVVLAQLDVRLDSYLRGQAMLAASKLLEATQEKGEQLFANFVTSRVAKQTNDDLILAFSAAAAIFPVLPAVAAKLFLIDGFVQQLVPNLEKNSDAAAAGKRKSRTLEQAALELLSAACVDKSCREAINRYCAKWLQDLTDAREGQNKALAALILAKINEQSADSITSKLSALALSATDDHQAIEGLAYTSLQPKIKEEICRNGPLLKKLVTTLKVKPLVTFGCLTIFSNITAYRPPQTDEQKKMSQLKAYANSSKPTDEDPLDDDKAVTARCAKVLDVGIVAAIGAACKQNISPTNTALAVRILLSLSKEQRHRPKMVQQGVVKTLLLLRGNTTKSEDSTAESTLIGRNASHALARALISVNPAHVFTSALPISSAVSALLPLLSDDTDSQQRDLLPTFEALLALTNMASVDDDTARELIIRTTFDKIEDLLFSPNSMIQRATVELVCNLMASPNCVAKFADGSKDSKRRMIILLALTDVEDLATRRAAGGALAALTQWDIAVTAVLDAKDNKGTKAVIGLCEDESEEVKHRGLVCALNVVSAPEGVGERGVRLFKDAGGVELLSTSLKTTKNGAVLQIGVEVLKKLV